MRASNWIATLTIGSVLLTGPVSAFAATAATKSAADAATTSEVTEEDVINAIRPADGMGGGMGSIMPPYYGGVTVDASVTKEVTPDFVLLNAYCDTGRQDNREEAKAILDKLYNDIRTAVGKDGRVRRMGSVSIYPFYDPTGKDTGSYTGNLSVGIRIINMSASGRISDFIESKGCSANWDVRLLDPQSFEMSVLDTLATRLNKRKAVFEKLLGKKLTTINSASLYTWVDGWSTYDPETNTADATTTLTITFGLDSKTQLRSSSSSSK